MQVQVTKDKVTILDKCTVKVHKGEYNINRITFDLSEEYTDDLVVNAIFSLENGKAYQMSILNNECGIPAEVLALSGIVTLGVYAYKVNNEELELRYSPYPTYFTVIGGSYDPTAEESQEITSSQFEQYMQALQDGLNQVNEAIEEVNQATDNANDLVDEINQKLENGDFIGPQGPIGPPGEQGEIGPSGTPGNDGVGITTITAGTPIVEDDKTITPITFNKTDSSTQTVNIEAQNGETQDLSGYVTNDVLDNIVPKNTSNGETVSVNDAIAYKAFDFEVDGASEQVTTTGKNLYNYEDTMTVGNDITVDEEGYITISYDNSQGESTVYKNYFTNPISLLKANTNYSFFAEVKSISGQGYFAMTSSDATSSVQQFNTPSIGNSIDFTDINNGEIIKKDYMSKENLNDPNINIGVRTFVGFNAGESGSITFRISLLENTSVTSENFVYEPYTGGQASPCPDYPQEITTLTFDEIIRCGKNLFGGVEFTKSTVGIDFTTYKDGSISAIGTATNQALSLYSADVSDYLRALVPGTYTLSGGQDNIQVQVVQDDGNALAITPKSSPYTITFDLNETKKIFVRALIDNGVTVNTTVYPMLEKGSTATEYEPYQATEYAIDLQGNEMVELPNGIKDELVIDKQGNVSLIKNIGKVVLDGSENWYHYNSGAGENNTYSVAIGNVGTSLEDITVISDKFVANSADNLYSNDIQGIANSLTQLIIRIDKNIASTISDFTQWLQTHNTIVYYQLAEAQTIQLGKLTDIITTLNGTNNISINGNIPTTISTTYALDIKKYIDNKLAEISTAMIEEG